MEAWRAVQRGHAEAKAAKHRERCRGMAWQLVQLAERVVAYKEKTGGPGYRVQAGWAGAGLKWQACRCFLCGHAAAELSAQGRSMRPSTSGAAGAPCLWPVTLSWATPSHTPSWWVLPGAGELLRFLAHYVGSRVHTLLCQFSSTLPAGPASAGHVQKTPQFSA
jgi:hypothetical protein